MDMEKIKALPEGEQLQRIYEIFNEDTRLNRSKSARVEFLTTVRYIEKYLRPGDKILDCGAGAGEYSLYFARHGFEVAAVELARRNIEAFRRKLTPDDKVELICGNALDLSRFEDGCFDVTFVLGPLYHLHRREDRLRVIEEAKRVTKRGGHIFFSFISNDFIFLTELQYDSEYLLTGDYDKESFKLHDFPFVFHTVDACRELLADGGIKVSHEVATDGASELMAEKIDAMDARSYEQYLKYHFYTCEKPELLGMTNHLLFVGKNER